jgi:hypothetical protein
MSFSVLKLNGVSPQSESMLGNNSGVQIDNVAKRGEISENNSNIKSAF